MLSDRFYLLCWRVLGSSGRFSIVWDRGADPCLPEDILPWRGKDKRQERNENKIQKDKMWQMMEVVKQWRKIGWVMSKRKRPSIHHTGLFIVTFDVQLTLVCEDVMLPEWAPRRDFWLLCGVPLRGETYGRGDDASDVRETGDWLECWAETGRQSQCRWEVDRYNALLPIQSSYTNVNAEC